MSLRTIASLAVAILLGLVAVLMIRNVLADRSPRSVAVKSTPVLVAAIPIDRGVTLKPAMLKVVNYPREAVPTGSFQTIDQVAGANARTVTRSMTANEPVLAAKVSGSGGKTNLSGTLAPGMRAVSVASSDVSGVGGFVLPGDRVDILVTREVGDGDKKTSVTQVLSENSLVLGVDQTSDQEANKPVVAKAITVEVTPEQAQAISLAQSVGQISLALRQVSDTAALARKATTISDLAIYGARKPAPPRPRRVVMRPHASGTQVRVTRGVETTGYSVSGV
jgi:pilus assembly protein CpaB